MRRFKLPRKGPTAASSRYCGSNIIRRSSLIRFFIETRSICQPAPRFTAFRLGPRGCCSPWLRPRRTPLLQLLNRNIEVRRVHYAFALELHPHAISPRPRELQTELELRSAIGDERMRVNQV